MSQEEIAVVVVVAVLGFWILGAYNRLVRLRQSLTAAFAPLDGLFRERDVLLVELLNLAAPLLPDAPEAIDAIDAARRQTRVAAEHALKRPVDAGPVASLALTEQLLHTAVTRLFTLVKARPAARTDPALRAQLKSLSTTQHRLSASRHAFNAVVRDHNVAVQQFPTRLVAAMFGFQTAGEL